MPTYSAIPGQLNLALVQADDFSAALDFSIDMSGYSVTAEIVSALTGELVQAMTATLTDDEEGQANVSLTDAQTAGLEAGTYRWRFVGTSGGLTRTLLEGFVEVTP